MELIFNTAHRKKNLLSKIQLQLEINNVKNIQKTKVDLLDHLLKKQNLKILQ